MEKLDKKTYRGIVKFTLESMLNLSKTDKNYNLAADTIYYYENTIVPEGQITQDEFLELCKEVRFVGRVTGRIPRFFILPSAKSILIASWGFGG